MIKDIDLAIKVSKLYYENDLTFTKIGNKLKLSRFQVANIIKAAKESGIVKILIEDKYLDKNIQLAEKIEKEFCIDRVIIVDNTGLPESELRKRVGYTSASFLKDILKDGDIVSLTTSSTINAVADSITNYNKIKDILIVEANGGSNITYSNSVHEISRKFAKTFNATHYSINAPIIVKSKSTKNILLEEKNLKKIFELFKKVNVLIFGIGTFYPKLNKLMLESGDLHKDEFLELKKLNAAGNIFYYYYDIEGNFLKTNFDDRIICFPKEEIRRIPYNVAIVYGKVKKYGVIGALRTKLIKFLIIDSELAESILDIKDISNREFLEFYDKDIDFNNYINNL